jgi:hypothetical protein
MVNLLGCRIADEAEKRAGLQGVKDFRRPFRAKIFGFGVSVDPRVSPWALLLRPFGALNQPIPDPLRDAVEKPPTSLI